MDTISRHSNVTTLGLYGLVLAIEAQLRRVRFGRQVARQAVSKPTNQAVSQPNS